MTQNTASFSWLALGDSYTIGTSVHSDETYVAQSAALLGRKGISSSPVTIAKNGWTTTDLLKAVDATLGSEARFDIITLLIGVNNQYQGKSLEEYGQQFDLLLKKSIAFAGGRPDRVVVLSVPDYSVTPFARDRDTKKIAAEIDSFNRLNRTLSEKAQVHYLDVTPASRNAAADISLVASDQLHFSGKAYAQWSILLAPLIESALRH